jgi:hypothetical protein
MRGPDDLDEDQRARIRYQVLSSLRGRRTTLGDRVYDALALAALPAPHIVRALAAVTLILGIVAGATVASADSVPDDALYGVKLAGEQMRLALALAPEDRASVELSMAEHRLAEAELLALEGRTSDALVATSSYGEHLANAAAALATVERLDPRAGPVVDRLRQRLADQQKRAAAVAARLASDPGSQTASVFRTIASVAPLSVGGLPLAAQIAEHAASVTERIASEAERLARGGQAAPARPAGATRSPAAATRTPSPTRTPARTDAPRPVGAGQPARTPAPQATTAPRPTPRETARPAVTPASALDAAEKAKRDAEKAREAADKAREAAKKTASPTPTPRH